MPRHTDAVPNWEILFKTGQMATVKSFRTFGQTKGRFEMAIQSRKDGAIADERIILTGKPLVRPDGRVVLGLMISKYKPGQEPEILFEQFYPAE